MEELENVTKFMELIRDELSLNKDGDYGKDKNLDCYYIRIMEREEDISV
jgi:hypothetical protein